MARFFPRPSRYFPFYYGLSYPMNAGLAQPFWLDSRAANPRPWRRGFINSLEQLDMATTATARVDGRENRAGSSASRPVGPGG